MGDGKSVYIWKDKWLLDKNNDRIEGAPFPLLENETVSALMHHQRNEWDCEAIQDLFGQRDARLILSIPLSVGSPNDKLIWIHEKDGSFSVKRCYKALIGDFLEADIANWTQSWNLKIPPKIKVFFWQACAGCTHTTDVLTKKNIDCPTLCQWCDREDETLIHIMYECDVPRNVWNYFPIVLPAPSSQSFIEWASYLFEQLSKEHISLFNAYC